MKKFYIFILFLYTVLIVAILPTKEIYAVDVGYSVSNEYKNSVYYDRLSDVTLTGDMRTDIVNIAKSQIGYHEGNSESEYGGGTEDADGEYTEYGYWYYNNVKSWPDLQHSAWCAMFVSWCARQANIPTDIIANSINATPNDMGKYVQGRHFDVEDKYYADGYVPMSGDLVFFDWTKEETVWSHVGIICDVIDNSVDGIDGLTILTIEGNSSNKVAVRAYSADDPVIRAYGAPNYTANDAHIHTWKAVKKTSCTRHGTKQCTGCEQTEDILKIEHQYWNWGDVTKDEDKPKFKHIDKAATCTDVGEKSFHCIRCSYRGEIETIPATGHDYIVSSRTEPTCEHTGMVYYVCNNDSKHTYSEEMDKLSHEESDWITDKEATYFEEGKRHTECKFCKKVMKKEVISKLNDSIAPSGYIDVNGNVSDGLTNDDKTAFYSNKNTEFIIYASDGESGIKEMAYYLSDKLLSVENLRQITAWIQDERGQIENDGKYIIYVRITDNAGNQTFISSACFEIDTALPEISGAENNKIYCISLKFTVNEDCAVKVGSNVLLKDINGYYILDTAGEHNISVTDMAGNTVLLTVTVNAEHIRGEFVEDIQPTCTTTGKNVCRCTLCDCVLETKETEALGHKGGTWQTVKTATCTEDGKKTQHCTVCKALLKEETIKAHGHDTGKWETVKAVTCTEDGVRQRICTICSGVIEKVTDKAQGHIPSQWTTQKEATCTTNGKEIKYCLTCSAITDENVIPSQGHILSDWVVITDATCTEDGKAVKYCTVCHEHIREQLMPSSGHEAGDWIKEYEPTCTEEGHNVKLCLKCGEVLDEEYIQANGHKLSYGKCVVCGYSSLLRWVIISAAVAAMLTYVTITVLHDIRRKRMK